MKKITTLMCAVALWCSAQAQAPALHFGRDGKFRIAQFTDVHLDLGTPYRRAQAEKPSPKCATSSMRSIPTWWSSRATW